MRFKEEVKFVPGVFFVKSNVGANSIKAQLHHFRNFEIENKSPSSFIAITYVKVVMEWARHDSEQIYS
jgi:hypothetical protein